MTARAWHSTAKIPADGGFDADEHDARGELLPGERIGPPLTGTHGKAMFRGAIALLIAVGGGWVLLSDRMTWPGWPSAETAGVSPSSDRGGPPVEPATPTPAATQPVEPAASTVTATRPVEATAPAAATTTRAADAETRKPATLEAPPATLQPPVPSRTAVTSGASERSSAPPLKTAALPPRATGVDEPPAPSVRAPIADPADPYQMRAAAVGLHPSLSRVLLAQLSPTDYRNAGTAIQTALAETPDSEVFVWPRHRKPELALFQVRFVPGAAPNCRRYVVTVTKDRWSTTALPIEKCGSQSRRPRRE
jgi:hypothetical protein